MAAMWTVDATAPATAVLAPADLRQLTGHVCLIGKRLEKITYLGASLFVHQAKYC